MNRRLAFWLLFSVGCASTPKAKPDKESTEYEVTSGAITLHVWAEGPRQAPATLLALNGGPGISHEVMDPLRALVRQDLRFVTFDQRAVGLSSSPPLKNGKLDPATFSLECYLADLARVIQSLPNTRIHLLGLSWGGFYAQAYAARHPDQISSLVLVDSLVPDSKTAEQGMKRFGARQKQLQAQGIVPDPIPKAVGTDCMPTMAAILPVYFYDPSHPITPELRATKCRSGVNAATFQSLGDFDISKELSSVNLPVLIIAGQEDPFGGSELADDIARAFEHARVEKVLLPHCGHLPFS